ncbi:MAG: 3-deoxy-manno-octulosonate cytidylyltransferase [Thermodesulfobacteriota bacterium]
MKKESRKVALIIPSRYGSTRFMGKPVAEILGKPMIEWVYERVKRLKVVSQIAVATDDPRIADLVRRFGGNAVITSSENRSGTDRVAEAAEIMGLDPEDIVINVQGDQPLIDPRCIEALINPFFEMPDLETATLAFPIVDADEITNPKDVKVVFDQDGYALYFSRSPIPFGRDPDTSYEVYKHLGIYAYTRAFLEVFRSLPEGRLERIEKLEQLRGMEYGHRIRVVVTEYDSPEVDQPEDIARIESRLRRIGSVSP